MTAALPSPDSVTRWLARAVVWLGVLCSGLSVFGQQVFTVLTNGPTANRINIVIVSEGYTAGELETFRTDATNSVEAMLSESPFALYRNMFNGYGIAVASNESGSDHPSRGVYKDTYFNSSFDSFGTTRLVTIPPNDFNYSSSAGTYKVTQLLNALVPEWDIVMILVNDTEYGGSGGGYLVVSKHSSSSEIARHELGHTFARLGDEYSTAYPGYPAIEEPNTTRETNRNSIKWNAWFKSSTPTPTPQTTAYGSVVGLFEGAHYNTTGWYRPKLNCKMKALGQPYCEVCAEALLTTAYSRINAAGDTYPSTNTMVTAASGSSLALSINPLVPSATRTVQWSLNSVSISGGTNISLSLAASSLAPGTNFVRCIVRDTTSLVKSDPLKRLQGLVEWRVNVDGAHLVMDPPVWLGGGRLALKVTGYAPKGMVIQTTDDFTHWTDLSIHGPMDGAMNTTNVIPSGITAVGFRAMTAE
jgi:hypothetical protein